MKNALLSENRPEDSARFIVVTKYQPLASLQALYDLGIRQMGESRVGEALQKMEHLPQDISWHLIGSLQKNKVSKVVGYFSSIHSVDSIDLAQKLSDVCVYAGIQVPVYIQVNPLHEPTKHGFFCEELEDAVGKISLLPALSIQGLMAMAPRIEYGEKAVHQTFSSVQKSFIDLQNTVMKGVEGFKDLSMGMSQDFEIALRYGATIVRLGSAFFRT
jgi:pyridoxal phosphate enzyme (YggS family)